MNFTVLKTYGIEIPSLEGPKNIPINETFDADPTETWIEEARSKGYIIATALIAEES